MKMWKELKLFGFQLFGDAEIVLCCRSVAYVLKRYPVILKRVKKVLNLALKSALKMKRCDFVDTLVVDTGFSRITSQN